MIKLKKALRKILVKRICDFHSYKFGEIWINFHLLDLINVWKRKGVNWKVEIAPKNYNPYISNMPWFHWWTPKWHDEKGPYITIGVGRLRFYRGY